MTGSRILPKDLSFLLSVQRLLIPRQLISGKEEHECLSWFLFHVTNVVTEEMELNIDNSVCLKQLDFETKKLH